MWQFLKKYVQSSAENRRVYSAGAGNSVLWQKYLVFIKKFAKLCDLQGISLSKKAFLRDSDLKSPSDLPRKSYVGSGVMIRIATLLLPLVVPACTA